MCILRRELSEELNATQNTKGQQAVINTNVLTVRVARQAPLSILPANGRHLCQCIFLWQTARDLPQPSQ